jgi:hypothetical protein
MRPHANADRVGMRGLRQGMTDDRNNDRRICATRVVNIGARTASALSEPLRAILSFYYMQRNGSCESSNPLRRAQPQRAQHPIDERCVVTEILALDENDARQGNSGRPNEDGGQSERDY